MPYMSAIIMIMYISWNKSYPYQECDKACIYTYIVTRYSVWVQLTALPAMANHQTPGPAESSAGCCEVLWFEKWEKTV